MGRERNLVGFRVNQFRNWSAQLNRLNRKEYISIFPGFLFHFKHPTLSLKTFCSPFSLKLTGPTEKMKGGGWRFPVRWPMSHHSGAAALETSTFFLKKYFTLTSSSPSSVFDIIFGKG